MSEMLSVRVIATTLCALSLAGCEPPAYGVDRSADVTSLPDSHEVLAILRSTRGVDSARYEGANNSPVSKAMVHTYYYYGLGGPLGVIQFSQRSTGVHFSHYYMQMGEHPPQSRIDSLVPIMRTIEGRLETEAGLNGLRAAIAQRCLGVRC